MISIYADYCYRQNILIYAKCSELYRYPELKEFYLKHRDGTILDAMHPQIYIERLVNLQNAVNQLQAACVQLQKQAGAT